MNATQRTPERALDRNVIAVIVRHWRRTDTQAARDRYRLARSGVQPSVLDWAGTEDGGVQAAMMATHPAWVAPRDRGKPRGVVF